MARIGINLYLLDQSGYAGGTFQFLKTLLTSLHQADINNQYILISHPDMLSFWKKEFPKFKVAGVQKFNSKAYIEYQFLYEQDESQLIKNNLWQRVCLTFKENSSISFFIKKIIKKFFQTIIKSSDELIYKNVETVIESYQINLWFCPMHQVSPLNLKIPVILWIPDIQHVQYPEFFDVQSLSRRSLDHAISVKCSDKVITISNFSRQEMIHHWKINPQKIQTIYLSYDVQTVEKYKTQKILKYLGVSFPYLIYPANLWPHKNHEILMQAMIKYNEELENPLHLVLVGYPTFHNIELKIKSYGEQYSWIHYLGYVSESEKMALLQEANALIYPSLYEGFGIPIIESMQLGTLVLASNCCSISEIVQDAGILFNPNNIDSLVEAIQKSEEKQNSQKLIDLGFQRMSSFKNEMIANQYIQLWTQCSSDQFHIHERPYVASANALESKKPMSLFFQSSGIQSIKVEGEISQSANIHILLNQTTIYQKKHEGLFQIQLSLSSQTESQIYQIEIYATSQGQYIKTKIHSLMIVSLKGYKIELIQNE